MWQKIFLILAMAMAIFIKAEEAALPTYYLGFLPPAPDAAIPDSLTIEWQSAFQVALEVLNGDSYPFKLEAISQNCTCDFQSAQEAVNKLMSQNDKLIGVVGPACSEAAMSAAKSLQAHSVALVSFAATASRLSDRSLYPNFFRTVYSDDHQAAAILASIDQLQMSNISLVYTNDGYSLALAQKLRALCGDNVFKMQLLELGLNASINIRELEGMLTSIEPFTFVVLIVQPAVAQKIWKLVAELGKLTYPWWYLGTDGVTASNPDTEGKMLQGEIGLAPYGGDSSDDLVCQKFFHHWNERSYPGLSNKSSSYVPYLIDSVKAFFEVTKSLHAEGMEVNSSNVLASFSSAKSSFKGCTGSLQLDPQTGSRAVLQDQPATYDFVSYMSNSWQLTGRIVDGNISIVQPLQRPGTFPVGEIVVPSGNPISKSKQQQQQEQSHSHDDNKADKALVAGIVVFSAAFILVSVTFICYHRIRAQSPMAFLRMPGK